MNRAEPYSSTTAIVLVLATFILAALVSAMGRAPQPVIVPTPALPILYVATAQPTAPPPTPDMAVQQELASLRARVAELEQERQAAPAPEPVSYHQASIEAAPTAGYVAHTTAGDIVIPPDATPVPENVPYTGPFLVPEATEPPSGPRLCDGFGDWRDYDPAYAASPACHK